MLPAWKAVMLALFLGALTLPTSEVVGSTEAIGLFNVPQGKAAFCAPLTNNDGIVYTTFVGVGMPPTHMAVVPDTGSYVLVAASTYCADDACKAHRRFEPDEPLGVSPKTFLLQYGQGGITVKDTETKVSFFGTEKSTVPIHEGEMVNVALIVNETLSGFSSAPYDGIMGLGKRKKTELKDTAFLEDMKVEGFTLCMGDPKLTGDGIGGRLDMHSQLDVGNAYKPVETIGEHVWGAVLDHVGVAGQVGSSTCSGDEPCATIIDSGTTLLAFPESVVDTLYRTIEAGCAQTNCLLSLQDQETCDGPHFEAMPNLELRVGGQDLVLPPSVYMGEMNVDIPTSKKAKVGEYEVYLPEYTQGIRCVPLLSSIDETTMLGPMSILGMPFLRQYAVYFDRKTWAMSVAEIKKGSGVCSRCGATLDEPAGPRKLQPTDTDSLSALLPEMEITGAPWERAFAVTRAAPMKASMLRGPSLHGVPKMTLPLMPKSAFKVSDDESSDAPGGAGADSKLVWVL